MCVFFFFQRVGGIKWRGRDSGSHENKVEGREAAVCALIKSGGVER